MAPLDIKPDVDAGCYGAASAEQCEVSLPFARNSSVAECPQTKPARRYHDPRGFVAPRAQRITGTALASMPLPQVVMSTILDDTPPSPIVLFSD